MSRLNVGSKSRLDKVGSKTSVSIATPVSHDIIPGKFTDIDWYVFVFL